MWVKISLSTNYNFYKLSSELEAVIIAVWVEHDWGEQGRDSSYNSRVVQTESAKFKHCIAIYIVSGTSLIEIDKLRFLFQTVSPLLKMAQLRWRPTRPPPTE